MKESSPSPRLVDRQAARRVYSALRVVARGVAQVVRPDGEVDKSLWYSMWCRTTVPHVAGDGVVGSRARVEGAGAAPVLRVSHRIELDVERCVQVKVPSKPAVVVEDVVLYIYSECNLSGSR